MATGNKVYEVLKLLRPYDIDLKKARVGSAFDGGYILVHNRTPDQVVLSYGIGGEISFDAEMAIGGHQCYMFDHTTTDLPGTHPNFHYYREGVAGVRDEGKSLFTIQDHLERFGITGNRLILKIDVEGAEWDVFSKIPDAVLSRFEQIALEVHDFSRLAEPEFLDKVAASLEKINRQFTLFHVHANNNNPMIVVSGYSIYNLLELSYVRTSIVKRMPSRTLYPTDLDSPNEHDREDYILSVFPYWPEGLSQAEYDAHAQKCQAKNEIIRKATLLFKEAQGHAQASDFEKAETGLRECLKLRPGLGVALGALVNVLNSKAIGLYNGQRYSEAVTALREALTIVPGHPDIVRNLESALSAAGSAMSR